MPPEVKKVVSSIDEMTCGNCVYGVITNTEKGLVARCHHFELGYEYDAQSEFCSEGSWRMSVAQNRISVNCFEVCYDYLSEEPQGVK